MNQPTILYSLSAGSPDITLVESLNSQLINDWILHPTTDFLDAQCSWKLGEGQYVGADFYNRYVSQLAETYSRWIQVVKRIVGSQIGGVVVGEYHFQRKPDGDRCKVAFIQFYRIEGRQIVSAQFYTGEVKTSADSLHWLADVDLPAYALALN
ncbi:hypothetical protein GCM10028808_09200 [Spirosoma migulaei]